MGVDSANREFEVYDALESGSDMHQSYLTRLGFSSTKAVAWMALPYAVSGSLSAHLRRNGRLGWEDLNAFGVQFEQGLNYLHSVGFLHLDLKPANLLWSAGTKALFLAAFCAC